MTKYEYVETEEEEIKEEEKKGEEEENNSGERIRKRITNYIESHR